MTLQELHAQKAEIEARIAEAAKASRDAAIAQIKALMADNCITAVDLGAVARPAAKRKPKTERPATHRDPATGATWGGRGKRPAWLNAALAAGKSIDAFAVQ
jgi:DNA-binding protein H-NS